MESSQGAQKQRGRRSVLLVDDELDGVLFFEMALASMAPEIDVVHAHDGAQATEMLRNGVGFVPDLIVTDLKMPGVNGFEFLAMLKAHPELSKLPVIVFSSSDENEDIKQALALGAKGYHVKPAGHHDLVEEVRRMYHTFFPSAVISAPIPTVSPSPRVAA